MRFIHLLLVLLFTSLISSAQINAVTENGDKVILKPDGTWSYTEGEAEADKPIPLNEVKFEKEETSTFLVKSKKLNIGVWINPKLWSFEKSKEGEASEFEFNRKGEDFYGLLITEKTEIPLESLRIIAINNAREAAPDLKVTKEEYRTVNGVQVLMMQMKGTIQGIRFVYFSYYYTSAEGSLQFITYTSESMFSRYEGEMEKLLNGFVLTTK